MDISNAISEVRNLIAINDLKAALALLHRFLQNHPILDEVILQSARLHDIERNVRVGTIDINQVSLDKNKIRVALLDIVREVDFLLNSGGRVGEEFRKIELGLGKEEESSTLTIENIKAKGNVNVKTKQEKSSVNLKDLESRNGKINIEIDQK